MIRMKEYTKPAFHLFLKEQYWHYLRLTDARTAAAYHLDSIWPPGHWIVTAIIHVWYLDYRTICKGGWIKKVKKEHINKHSIYTRILIPYVWFSHMFTWQVKSCNLPFSRCLIIATFHGDVPMFWCSQVQQALTAILGEHYMLHGHRHLHVPLTSHRLFWPPGEA